MIFETTGTRPYSLMFSKDPSESREGFRQYWNFWKTMGYDTASMEFCICDILYSMGGGALGAHKEGCIKDRDDFERFPWEEIPVRFFEKFGPAMKTLAETCPQGMKAVGGVGNGIFECVQDLVGYMDLCFLRSDDEELYADLFKKMGDIQTAIWEKFLREYSDAYCVLRFGDDLGFNTMTLLPTEDVKAHILPQYRRITDLVHNTGRPFLLHSCGNLFAVFDDIIDMANINAKHSNEDGIAHFTVWVDKLRRPHRQFRRNRHRCPLPPVSGGNPRLCDRLSGKSQGPRRHCLCFRKLHPRLCAHRGLPGHGGHRSPVARRSPGIKSF